MDIQCLLQTSKEKIKPAYLNLRISLRFCLVYGLCLTSVFTSQVPLLRGKIIYTLSKIP